MKTGRPLPITPKRVYFYKHHVLTSEFFYGSQCYFYSDGKEKKQITKESFIKLQQQMFLLNKKQGDRDD